MSKNKRFEYDESKLHAKQKAGALALVEYEFTPNKERKTKQQIADEIGVSRKTLHEWNTRNTNFIAYKNAIASDFLNTNLSFVYSKLIDGINNGSMKGIEIYMKRMGDLDSRNELIVHNAGDSEQSFEDRRNALLERLRKEQDEGGAD